MSDSDDSDVPLSLLAKRKKAKLMSQESSAADEDESSSSEEEEEAEFQDDDGDEDFEEDASSEEDEEDGDFVEEESSDDDVPLSKLKSPKKQKPKKAKAKAKAKTPPAKKKTTAKKKIDTKAKKKKKKATPKKAAKRSSSTASSSKKPSASAPNLPCFALYDNVDKGLLIQRLLCRWWYATSWPNPADLPTSPPKGYDSLDGFPGVYVCSRGSSIGKLVDKRDKSTAPNFANYVRKSAEELQGLLLKAITEQRRQLVEAEGSGTDTEKELNNMEKWARKLNCSKVDKDAARALKAAGIPL